MQLFLVLFFSLSSQFHDLHLSMCNLEYNEEGQRIELQQRIFFDDLENMLKLRLENDSFDILHPESSSISYDSLFTVYLNENIDFSVDGNKISMSLLEYEINDQAIVFYLYALKVKKFSDISFHSHILFDLFEDQTNVVSIKWGNKKKSGRFRIGSDALKISG